MHSQKLRIFVDCHVFDDEFQGMRTYLQGLYLELIKDKGRQFFMVANDVANLENIFGKRENVTYLRYTSHSKLYRLLIDTPYLIKKHKIDFAHFQYRVPPVKLCKYIVTIHDVLFEDFPEYFPKLDRIGNYVTYTISGKMSEIVLTVSEYSKRQIRKHLGIKSMSITPNAVDPVFFEEYDKEEVRRQVSVKFGLQDYIIYIGRWEPRKNHHMILKAFINLKLYKRYKLLFIGDESITNPKYEALYRDAPDEVKQQVIIMRRVAFNEMLTLLRGASFSVYPTVAEGFGIPPLEALAAGIPTISSNTTAMQDFSFLKDYFFDPADQQAFEQMLAKLINQQDYNDFKEIKAAVKEKYSWKKAAEAYNAALEKYLDK